MVVSLFAIEVAQDGQDFRQTFFALLMHLIPTFAILAVPAFSWRREWVAGALFIALAVFSVVWAGDKPFGVLWAFLLMAGPRVVTGVLFLLNWRYIDALRGGSSSH